MSNHPTFVRVISILVLLTPFSMASATMVETAKLFASDGTSENELGISLAMDQGYVVAGAPGSLIANHAGAAYVFDAATGTQTHKLTGSDQIGGDYFAKSVAASGNKIAVGSPFHANAQGAAYVFDAGTGAQLSKLTANDAAAGDRFGWSTAMSGNAIVVGAMYDDDNGINSGSAYVFDASTGNQLHKLIASDGLTNDQFGAQVAIDGNRVVIGAGGHDDNGALGGAAYLFDANTGNQLAKLVPDDPETDARFGTAVAVSGDLIAVGASGDDIHGSVYLFDATSGTQLAKLGAPGSDFPERFGQSIAVNSSRIVIGASGDYDGGGWNGAAYVFDLSSYQLIEILVASDASSFDVFAEAVAMDDDYIMVGSIHSSGVQADTGAIYKYSSDAFGVPTPGTLSLLLISAIAALSLRKYSLGTSKVALLIIVFAPVSVVAGDSNGRYAIKGVGANSCAQFVNARKTRAPETYMYLGWFQGWLSHENHVSENTFDLASWQHTGTLLSALDEYCRSHLSTRFVFAAQSLINAMQPSRLQEQSLRVAAVHDGRSVHLYEQTLSALQKALIAEDLLDHTASGEFDAATREAIVGFQSRESLPVTGLPDQVVLQRLLSAPPPAAN